MTTAINDAKLFEIIESLLYRPELYTKEKIENHANTLAIAFFQRTDRHSTQKDEFSAWLWKEIKNHKPITPKKIINHRFMQSMLSQRLMNEKIHIVMLSNIIPRKRSIAMYEVPHLPVGKKQEKAINKWYAGFVESFMPDEVIEAEFSNNERIYSIWRSWDKQATKYAFKHPEIQKKFKPIDEKTLDITILLKNAEFTGELNANILEEVWIRLQKIDVKMSIIKTEILSSDPEIVKKLISSYLQLFQLHQKIYSDPIKLDQFKGKITDHLYGLMSEMRFKENEQN